MKDTRLVITQYCDDVRQEVGNKFSLMGCYGGEMVFSKLPAVYPKLCAQIRVQTPKGRPFKNLVLRAFLNEEQLAELSFGEEQLAEMNGQIEDNEVANYFSIMVIMQFSPLLVEGIGQLRVDAETEEGLIKGNSLWLREAAQDKSSASAH